MWEVFSHLPFACCARFQLCSECIAQCAPWNAYSRIECIRIVVCTQLHVLQPSLPPNAKYKHNDAFSSFGSSVTLLGV